MSVLESGTEREDSVELASSCSAVDESGHGLRDHHELPVEDSEGAQEKEGSVRANNENDNDEASLESSDDEDDEVERWFKASNLFFFGGSGLYLWQAIKWVVDAYSDKGKTDELGKDDDSSNDDDGPYYFALGVYWDVYKLLGASGALCYLANSIAALRVSIVEMRHREQTGRFGDDPRWEVGVACTFGTAAMCDLVGEFIFDDKESTPSYVASSAAVHVYLLNAVMTILGRLPRFSSWPLALMSAGDILFLTGTIVDVLVSYIDNPRAPSSWDLLIAWSSFTSAVLWLIDSILYILADFVTSNDIRLADDYALLSSRYSGETAREQLEFRSVVSSETEGAVRSSIEPKHDPP